MASRIFETTAPAKAETTPDRQVAAADKAVAGGRVPGAAFGTGGDPGAQAADLAHATGGNLARAGAGAGAAPAARGLACSATGAGPGAADATAEGWRCRQRRRRAGARGGRDGDERFADDPSRTIHSALAQTYLGAE